MILALLLGIVIMLPLSFIPVRVRGGRLPVWVATYMARLFNLIFNVKFAYRASERLWQHTGFLFPNHSSYLDIIAMLHFMPVRFLAAIEVRQRPMIGWIAEAIDCVFVTRENQASRHAARDAIVSAMQDEPQPPVVIYPEGRLGPGDYLHPFRFGAFEMAVENGLALLPVAICYSHKEVVVWHGPRGEPMLTAIWRHAKFPGPVYAEMIVLEPVCPQPDDEPKQLALDTQTAMADVLGVAVLATDNIESITKPTD